MKLPSSKAAGRYLIIAGVAGLIIASILSFTIYSGIDRGAVPAVSFLFIMIGMCFYFPSLLEETNGEISTMRVIVFAVVMVFVFIYVKIGWNAGTFEEFTIDDKWVYILGIAFGSKAVQKFAEEEEEKDKKEDDK
jgi:hypothetical protein